MVREGLLKADSPRGVWEISGAGRARLAAGTAGQGKEGDSNAGQ